jgi:hypothetical protein
VRGSAEDAYSAGGVFDDGHDVQAGAGQRRRFEEVGCDDGVRLGAEERRAQVSLVRWGAGSIPASLRISQTVEAATLTPSTSSSPWILRYPHVLFSRASRSTRVRIDRRFRHPQR